MAPVSGFVIKAPGEPSVYIAGDTLFCGEVREVLETMKPDVVVVNAGAAEFSTGEGDCIRAGMHVASLFVYSSIRSSGV